MFCIRLGPLLSLPASSCWIDRFEDVTVIVIERYDRMRMDGSRRLPIDRPGGEVRRVHQEDFCQALRIPPHDKYQNRGGPGMRSIMRLLSESGSPGIDRDRFMRACAYNFVISAPDAHGKNYSLVLGAQGRFRLAPLYDLASWLPYSQVRRDRKLAMSIAGHYNCDEIMPRHCEEEARHCESPVERAVGHIRDILAHVPGVMHQLHQDCQREDTTAPELTRLVGAIEERCARLATAFGAEAFDERQQSLPGL